MRQPKGEKHDEGEMFYLKQFSCQGNHTFAPDRKARQVKCGKCGVGFIVPVGSTLKEGHIYIKDAMVI